MRFLKIFHLLLIFNLIFSCSSDADQDLNISDLTLTISDIEKTTATIRYFGNIQGEIKKIVYRERNSIGGYQTMVFENNEIILSNLIGATEYEVKFEISNNNSNIQSHSYYFTTKSVSFDYDKLYAENSGYFSNGDELFSHLNKKHVIHAEGLSDFSDVKVFLVNEQKTDSLEIHSTVISDSLTFTVPENYLSQTPRESVKKAWVGIKIKDSYNYILNEYGWINTSLNPNYSPENDTNEVYVKLKIFNDKPFIESVNITTGSNNTCLNYTRLWFNGEFYTSLDEYYWKPSRAELILLDATGGLYKSFTYNYDNNSTSCSNYFLIYWHVNSLYEDFLLKYHQDSFFDIKISNLPLGNYSAKIVFTFEDVSESFETNTINFTKE